MRSLVVYESMFGNTKVIAEAIAEGLSAHSAVDIEEVGDAPTSPPPDMDLLVVGGPTHAFGMSRASTRQSAGEQAEHGIISSRIGLREWIDGLRAPGGGIAVATFDTRIARPRVPGSAARRAEKRLVSLGYRAITRPKSFWVQGTPGPLVEGESERATRWAENLAARLSLESEQLS
jgi:hypothetical protein